MKRMMIGTLAAASGVKITTIRYYERAGLMAPPARTPGRHRNYTEDHLARLLFICRARELEFSLQDIRKLLVLADPTRPACREVERLAADHLQRLRKKVAGLVKLEAMLSHAVAQCDGETGLPCPVLTLLTEGDGRSHSVADRTGIGGG
ncbi:MAG TPA: MerR family transcriptional regulator [Xanthobacteraceae bacterium]|nr:MerR family transcriptional regulator [Xanthobacteraceae bacterium]